MLRTLLWVSVSLMLLISGCAAGRLSDETLNRIAQCTGGLGDSQRFKGAIDARIDENSKAGVANANINYDDIVQGVIFADSTISENLKQVYFTGYQACMDKWRSDGHVKEEAPKKQALAPGDDWNEPQWAEARANIQWVIQRDAGAKRRYDDNRARGASKYAAVVAAQGHNPNAQRTIQGYGEVRTDRYIGSLGH